MSARCTSPSACCLASFSRSGGLSGSSSLASIDSFRVDVSSAGASSSSASAPSAGSSRSGFCSISVRMRSTSSSRESCSSLIACCSCGVITSCWLRRRLCLSSRAISTLSLSFQLEPLAQVHGAGALRSGDLGWGARLQKAPLDEQDGAVADAQGLTNGVIADEDAEPPLAQFPDQPLQLVHGDGVDAGEGLVEEEEARLGEQRPRDLRPTPLPSRELLAQRVGHAEQVELLQHVVGPAARFVAVHAVALEDEEQVLPDGQLAEDARFLRQVAQPHPGAAVEWQAGQVLAAQVHLALVGVEQPHHAVEAGRLPGAIGTQEAHHLAGVHVEGDPVHDLAAPEALRQTAGVQGAHRFPPAPASSWCASGRSRPCARSTRTSCESSVIAIFSPTRTSPRSNRRGSPVNTT